MRYLWKDIVQENITRCAAVGHRYLLVYNKFSNHISSIIANYFLVILIDSLNSQNGNVNALHIYDYHGNGTRVHLVELANQHIY